MNRNNDFKAILYKNGAAFALDGVTKIELRFKGVTYGSDVYAAAFDFPTGETGEIVFHLGKIPEIASGRDRKAELILYDETATQGLVWGLMDIDGEEVE